MKIYLATPYSHPDPEIKQWRFENINRVAASLIRSGHFVYSPISHTHPIAVAGDLPKGFDFWEEYDRTFIEGWADELWVHRSRGWKESKGVQAEIEIAKKAGKPVRYI